MAETGTPTPNLGLRIPVGTDPASVDDINYNSNLLDTVLGAVGNTSVKDQLDELSDQIANSLGGFTNIGTYQEISANSSTTVTVPATDRPYVVVVYRTDKGKTNIYIVDASGSTALVSSGALSATVSLSGTTLTITNGNNVTVYARIYKIA